MEKNSATSFGEEELLFESQMILLLIYYSFITSAVSFDGTENSIHGSYFKSCH